MYIWPRVWVENQISPTAENWCQREASSGSKAASFKKGAKTLWDSNKLRISIGHVGILPKQRENTLKSKRSGHHFHIDGKECVSHCQFQNSGWTMDNGCQSQYGLVVNLSKRKSTHHKTEYIIGITLLVNLILKGVPPWFQVTSVWLENLRNGLFERCLEIFHRNKNLHLHIWFRLSQGKIIDV